MKVAQQNGKLIVSLPRTSLDPIDTIVRLELNRPAIGFLEK